VVFINRFDYLAKIGDSFFIKNIEDICMISDHLEGIKNLALHDQYIFSLTPLKIPMNRSKAKKKLDHLR
jgi:hypothetical protein